MYFVRQRRLLNPTIMKIYTTVNCPAVLLKIPIFSQHNYAVDNVSYVLESDRSKITINFKQWKLKLRVSKSIFSDPTYNRPDYILCNDIMSFDFNNRKHSRCSTKFTLKKNQANFTAFKNIFIKIIVCVLFWGLVFIRWNNHEMIAKQVKRHDFISSVYFEIYWLNLQRLAVTVYY